MAPTWTTSEPLPWRTMCSACWSPTWTGAHGWWVTTATIADVANYAYIAHAPEGGVSLDDYPNVRTWLGRIAALPGFVPMRTTAVGLAA
ncbi:MAG: hypothetical protein R3E50_12160 [Halioglobus sp.]